MNDKLIIHNYTNLSDIDVLNLITKVVKMGKISETKQGKQYCFATIFTKKHNIEDRIVISSTKRNNTFTFVVQKERL